MTKIKDMPVIDRPVERLYYKGVEALSNEELLAILLKTGNKRESAKEVAIQILKQIENIQDLKTMSLQRLMAIDGIGMSKAAIILASLELGNRVHQKVDYLEKKKANDPELLYEYYKVKLSGKKQEHFYAVYLDQQKKIIEDKLLFIGTINYSMVHPREIFNQAYLLGATAIILIHNHPSGIVMPSQNDIDTTSKLCEVGNLLGVPVIDHIIIGENEYYSFFEQRKKDNA